LLGEESALGFDVHDFGVKIRLQHEGFERRADDERHAREFGVERAIERVRVRFHSHSRIESSRVVVRRVAFSFGRGATRRGGEACDGSAARAAMASAASFSRALDGVAKCGRGAPRGTDAASTTTRERRARRDAT
tara:strand:- start:697 stop:1101 length:405 start_codon:yes stop_codon:yes gene_type:complete